jgi:hypothetical protein
MAQARWREDPSLLLLTLLAFLFPVAVYCWVLGMINRRLHPLLVPGPWDFVGLLFAGSGFLLWVGPILLKSLFSQALRNPPLGDRPAFLTTLLWNLLPHEAGVWAGYYVVVLGGALLLLLARRRKTVIYNVDPVVLETVLTRSLARLGLTWTRQGNRLYLSFGAEPVAQDVPAAAEAITAAPAALRTAVPAAPPVASLAPAILDLEFFRATYNVTLHWRSRNRAVRDDVEAELSRELAEVLTQNNPAGTWLLGISGCLFVLMFFSVLVVVLNTFLSQRR